MSSYALPLRLPALLRSAAGPRGAMTEAVAAAQGGDRDAFEQLYRAHAGQVFAVCLRLTGDPVRAEEYLQDVFVRLWERLPSFRGEAAFSSWLYRLTVNVVLQADRSDRRRERRVRSSPDPPDATALPDRTAERLDLEQGVARLPEAARRVFVLHDVYGYRHPEVAEMLGIAVGTSKAHLHRARRILREVLAC